MRQHLPATRRAARLEDDHDEVPGSRDRARAPHDPLAFGRAAPLPLDTNVGRVFFSLGQALEAVREGDGTFRLRTLEYWYRVQETADPKGHAFLRWEYMRPRSVAIAGPPRHHVHARAVVPVAAENLDLNKVHVPTGWVTIEEVIRFLIHELGVKPPCGKSWPSVLAESEDAFYERFTGKRYTPPRPRRR